MEPLPTDPQDYSGPFNYSHPPKEIGIFSLTSGGFFSDGRNLKYYKEPKQNVHFDLDKGYPEKFVDWKNKGGGHGLDHILKWIKVNPSKLSGVDFKFVTLRGQLTKVACTPYVDDTEGWKLAVTKFNKKWYISKLQVDEQSKEDPVSKKKKEPKKNENYRGHKFEQHLTADTADGEPNTDAAVDLNEAFYTVVTSNLNKSHSLLFSAEVDARVRDKSPPECYVEMKTSRRRPASKWKLQNCWVQSYLVGVPKIVFGFRDDDEGVVSKVEEKSTDDIPAMVAKCDKTWKAFDGVCMNFCDAFLSYVKKWATKDDASVVYLFQQARDERNKRVVTWTECSGSVAKPNLLPAWYIDAVQK